MAGSPFKRLLAAGGCAGKTEKGQPCKARDVYENGRCKNHGGEGKSLRERRFALMLEGVRRQCEESDRRRAEWERNNPELKARLESARVQRKARVEAAKQAERLASEQRTSA